MDENAINWICRNWNTTSTKHGWRNISNQFHGAGMAVFHFDSQAALDYWTLADVATKRLLDCEDEH